MYKMNKIGPWPVIDPSTSKDQITATPTDIAVDGSETLRVWLNTANLGSKSEAYVRAKDWTSTTLAEFYCRSYGVCLQPLEDFITSNNNVILDLNIHAMIPNDVPAEGTSLVTTPIIGYIDTAGAAIGTGWNANNLVTDYAEIPASGHADSNLSINTQVLLSPILSGSLDLDKFLFAGIRVYNQDGTAVVPAIEFTICARYFLASKPTNYRGV